MIDLDLRWDLNKRRNEAEALRGLVHPAKRGSGTPLMPRS
jgi:hypothetical protein